MTHRAFAPGSRLTLEANTWIPPEIAPSAFIPDTNVIERLHEEFRWRVKTQGSLPTEEAALVLLFGLVASSQIRLRRVDGWRQISAVLKQRRTAA
jgi:transposase-like protein